MPNTYAAEQIGPFTAPEFGSHVRYADASFGRIHRSGGYWWVEDTDGYGDWTGKRNERVGSHPYLAEFLEALRQESRTRKRKADALANEFSLDDLPDDDEPNPDDADYPWCQACDGTGHMEEAASRCWKCNGVGNFA